MTPEASARGGFWRQALAIRGSVSPRILPRVLASAVAAALLTAAIVYLRRAHGVDLVMAVAPYEFAGTALGLLLVLRINAGNDRWYEARRLWGGIVNQSRNVAIDVLAYGPAEGEADRAWRDRTLRWTAAFPHAVRGSLRGEGVPAQVAALVGDAAAARVAAADHAPSAVALELARELRAVDGRMDRFAFLQVDRERAALVDHVGGCERILKTPLPFAVSTKVRRFIVLYLLSLPFGLLRAVDAAWLVPVLVATIAYPLFAIDQLGAELQNPFAPGNLSHLPLDDLCATVERNVLGLLASDAAAR